MRVLHRILHLFVLIVFASAPVIAEVTYTVTFENGVMKIQSSPDESGFYEVYTVPADQVRLETFKNGGSSVSGSSQPMAQQSEVQFTEAQRFEMEVLRLTNENRKKNGLPELKNHEGLHKAATGHSEEMIRLNYFDHNSPVQGRTRPSDRVKQAGVDPLIVAENIFQCSGHDPEAAAKVTVDGWMESPGHRFNILDPESTHVGIGYAKKGEIIMVTQVFAGGL